MKRTRLFCLFACLLLLCHYLSAQEQLDSAVVVSSRKSAGAGSTVILPVDIRMTASPVGVTDAVKYIQTLPGVSSGMEGTSAYYVRGGNYGGNMVSLDGVPIYASGHILGLTTVLPDRMLSGQEFFMGGFNSEDGGFTSSLLKLHTTDGNMKKQSVSVSLNNLFVGSDVSLPLSKDKLSLLVSGRLSPAGKEYNLLRPALDASLQIPDKINATVWDAFTKLTWVPSVKDRLLFSVFRSVDSYGYVRNIIESDSFGWDNLVTSLSWTHCSNEKWNWKSSLSFNNSGSSQQRIAIPHEGAANSTRMDIKSRLQEYTMNVTVSHRAGKKVDFQLGAENAVTRFIPGIGHYYLDDEQISESGNGLITMRGTMHGQLFFDNGRFHIRTALRANVFKGEDIVSIHPEARIYAGFDLNSGFILQATYDHLVQFYHSLEGIPTGWSMEMLVPASERNRPESSDQLYVGLARQTKGCYLSAAGFYKRLHNLTYYADAASFFTSSWGNWRDNIQSGEGTSYGFEFNVKKEMGLFIGQLSYTLSKTDRLFEHINSGVPFPFKFDRRHIFSLTASCFLHKGARFTHNITSGLSWSTGHWESVRSGTYHLYPPGPYESIEDIIVDYTSHPNNLRLPPYFRLDAGYHMSCASKHFTHDLSIGVYNLTNRHNAFSLTWDSGEEKWKKLSIFPIMPNFCYTISFN